MKKVIRLTESDLSRIVKRVIFEQANQEVDQNIINKWEQAIDALKTTFKHIFDRTLDKTVDSRKDYETPLFTFLDNLKNKPTNPSGKITVFSNNDLSNLEFRLTDVDNYNRPLGVNRKIFGDTFVNIIKQLNEVALMEPSKVNNINSYFGKKSDRVISWNNYLNKRRDYLVPGRKATIDLPTKKLTTIPTSTHNV